MGLEYGRETDQLVEAGSRLRKPGIATQKYKHVKSTSLNFHVSASTALIDDYHKMLLDIINRQKSVSIKQLI